MDIKNAHDTGWRLYGGVYHKDSGFQPIRNIAEIILYPANEVITGPPQAPDGHLYAILNADQMLVLERIWSNPEAYHKYGIDGPFYYIIFEHTQFYKNLKLRMKLRK